MDTHVDPVIRDAVTLVRDRFGADGLRDLVLLSQQEIVRVEATMSELADLDVAGRPGD